MIWNAAEKLDFTEEEVKFINLLVARYAKANEQVDITEIDGLKKEMEREKIPTKNLDALIKKMEHYQILKSHIGFGDYYLTLSSLQVRGVQKRIQEITCPDCGRRTLVEKVVIYCPACDFVRNKEQAG